MDFHIDDILKLLLQSVILPVLGGIAYFFKRFHHRIDSLEKDVDTLDTRITIVETKIDDIRDDIREIKRGVERLIDLKAKGRD